MPCMDGGPTPYEMDMEQKNKITFLSRSLCAVMRELERAKQLNHVLDHINWRESGVTRAKVEKWWFNHKKEDKRLKELKESTKERKKKIKLARSKLTKEELSLLGLE